MIQVQDLVKVYQPGNPPAVDGVSFTVEEGRWYTLLGPSGCGKTTTLRCIAGLERPDGGTIDLGGVAVVGKRTFVPTHRRDIGMVFQSYAVWPHMTVFDNVAFPLQVAGKRRPKSEIQEKVRTSLELVGLGGLEKRMATQLSGGQQQRLSVARALVREPSVLLLDEPLSNLDAKLRERMRGELLLIQQRVGITTLFVTHDQVEALAMSDQIAVMDGGKIVQQGAPREIYHQPANEFVAGFIGSTNLVQGKYLRHDEETGNAVIELPFGIVQAANAPVAEGESVVVALRPEDVVIHRGERHQRDDASAVNLYDGEIEIGLFSGTSVDYHIKVNGSLVQARVGSRVELERGDRVRVELPVDAVHVFQFTERSAKNKSIVRSASATSAALPN